MNKPIWIAAVCLAWLVGTAQAAGDFLIKDNDRVVVYGDSITDRQLYPRIIDDFLVTRHPAWNVELVNRGWGGDMAHYYGRFQRDCLSLKPTLAIICLGMNDANYTAFDLNDFGGYVHFLNRMVQDLKKQEFALALVSPPTYDVLQLPKLTHPGNHKVYDMSGYPEVLREFSLGMFTVAKVHEVPYVNLNERYSELLGIGRARFGASFRLTGAGDGVHPQGPGQLAMAAIILQGLGAPTERAVLDLDARTGTVKVARGTRVSDLAVKGGEIRFQRTDESLPLPMYEGTEPVFSLMNVAGTLNGDWLKVQNLPAGSYALTIDTRQIVVKPAEEWAAGVNLSIYSYAPPMLQAGQVARATVELHQARYEKWRKILCKKVQWVGDASPYDTSDTKAMAQVDRKIADIKARRKALATPRAYRFCLQRVP